MTAPKAPPQAFISSYAPRLRQYTNPLLTPSVQPTLAIPLNNSRTTKRGTTAINYAEDGYDDYDDDEDEGRRRPTGLRSLRANDPANQPRADHSDKYGLDTHAPVQVQGIWRDWMGRASNKSKPDIHTFAQAALPLTLIPIRIDLDVPAFVPPPPLPLPSGPAYARVDTQHPIYRTQEITPPYRLKDIFMWNLHETLTTTDQFAQVLVQDLELPNKLQMALEISKQIRTQLEEYAGVALHPLFHPYQKASTRNTASNNSFTPAHTQPATPQPSATPVPNGSSIPPTLNGLSNPATKATDSANGISATATIPIDFDETNPDDTYRCIINLNINLSSFLFTDRFEWSLLHGSGMAEMFAKQTCMDIGLAGEWVPAVTHAIYEAVLRLKKEACESGGISSIGDLPNEAANGAEAGWRYDPEHLADEWKPRIEQLSKEEIEKREGDRERQIRRLRRETARFSTTTNISTEVVAQPQEEERMGRGERTRKKRRFRSPSPTGTPSRDTPSGGVQGYGGGGTLNDNERYSWRCAHCWIWGSSVWATRDGPNGPRVCDILRFPDQNELTSVQSLCGNCGLLYERNKKLPAWCKELHWKDLKATDFR